MAFTIERLALAQDHLTDINGRHIESRIPVDQCLPNRLLGRENSITNSGALREFHQRKDDVHGLISFLRASYDQTQLTLGQLFELSCLIATLPVYLVLRRSDPVGLNNLPPSTIDASRSVAGILIVSLQMQGAGFPEEALVDENQFYDFANGSNPLGKNYFVQRATDISCPAPEDMVKPFLQAMLYRSDNDDASSMHWNGLIQKDEIQNVLKFGPAYVGLRTFYKHYQQSLFGNPTERLKLRELLEDLYPKINIVLGYET